jgi:hypothetical protein
LAGWLIARGRLPRHQCAGKWKDNDRSNIPYYSGRSGWLDGKPQVTTAYHNTSATRRLFNLRNLIYAVQENVAGKLSFDPKVIGRAVAITTQG